MSVVLTAHPKSLKTKKTQRNAESFASTRSRGRQMGFAANL